MVVSPTSLLTLSTNELAIITVVESAIDKELRLKFQSGKATYIRSVLIRPVLEENPALLVELKARYASSGWTIVEYNSPEGIWLSFAET